MVVVSPVPEDAIDDDCQLIFFPLLLLVSN
jgi:hypothetical protein